MLYGFDAEGVRHIVSEIERGYGLCATPLGFPDGTIFLPHSPVHEACVIYARDGGSPVHDGYTPEPVNGSTLPATLPFTLEE